MRFTSKLSPDQWADARRLREGGTTFAEIGRRLGIKATAVSKHAQREGWAAPASEAGAPTSSRRLRPSLPSPGTAGIRGRLALRLYRVIECKIRMMELRMIKELQAHEDAHGRADAGDLPPPPIRDDRESFAALIDSINQVTEMASEPAPATDGRRRAAAGAVNPELTALSADIDPDGLAVASEKDNFRRELAEHLGRMFPKP